MFLRLGPFHNVECGGVLVVYITVGLKEASGPYKNHFAPLSLQWH